jgi:hypothetical protein
VRLIVIPVQHILAIQQAMRATTALNSLIWSKDISVNTKKQIFYSDKAFQVTVGNYGHWITSYRKTVKYINGILKMNCKNLHTTKRNEVIREKVWETDDKSE